MSYLVLRASPLAMGKSSQGGNCTGPRELSRKDLVSEAAQF